MKVIFIFMIQLKMSLFSWNVEDLKMVTLFYILLPSFDLGKWKNGKYLNQILIIHNLYNVLLSHFSFTNNL